MSHDKYVVRTPWYEGLGKCVFIFMAGLNYFGVIHVAWDSFIKWAWLNFTVLLVLKVFLGAMYALKSIIDWLLLRLGEDE
jgi:hypothetical protein